jgi:hypothetical protein
MALDAVDAAAYGRIVAGRAGVVKLVDAPDSKLRLA